MWLPPRLRPRPWQHGTRTKSAPELTTDAPRPAPAARWGILPAYHSWQGDVVQTDPQVEAAILEAMGAKTDAPPEPHAPPPGGAASCETAPDRAWGWAVQLYGG